MNPIKTLALAAALALPAIASADPAIRGTLLTLDDAGPGVFTDTWTFDSADFDPLAAGADFQDYFIFNPPEDESLTIHLSANGVNLTSFDLRDYTSFAKLADGTVPAAGVLGPYDLTSGVYWLDVYGLEDAAGGHYVLQISSGDASTPPPTIVPEPGALALMLAGLGVVAARARRQATALA